MKRIGILALTASLLCGNFHTLNVAAQETDTDISVLEMSADTFSREPHTSLQELTAEREIMALVYMSPEYDVKVAADPESATLVTVPSGQTVFIEDIRRADDGQVWGYVRFYCGENMYRGYIKRSNLACADERFLEWERVNGMNSAVLGATDPMVLRATAAGYTDVEQFPASYQEGLRALKAQHPNWVFVPMNTNLKWNEVIANELSNDRSWVYKTLPADAKGAPADTSGNWFTATPKALQYYMDPRNALTEKGIFQFEQLTYNASYHTESAVTAFLNNTFMKGNKYAPGTQMTYAHIIWTVGRDSAINVSPFHLASRIYQEQGDGTSDLISGTYHGYEGYYNYFNVGATGHADKEVIESGLSYAKKQNWNNAEVSIRGGAALLSANYIRRGQDTLYLEKFNVNPQGTYSLYTHQYMQNIVAPTSEAISIRDLYARANALNSTFVFKIPVFLNMPVKTIAPGQPGETIPEPTTDIYLQIPNGYDTTEVYLDGVAYKPKTSNGKYMITAPDAKARTVVAYRYNASGVPTGKYTWKLTYANGAYTATAVGAEALTEPVANFPDVRKSDWFGPAVQFVYDNGIMTGMGKTFQPNGKLTREQFVQVLYSHSGKPTVTGKSKFPDVRSGQWYEKAVIWATVNGITSGNGDGTFGVGQNISREALAVMLYKYARLKGYDLSSREGLIYRYADGSKVSTWAREAMNWAISQGVISGKGSGGNLATYKLDPQGFATRAECAAMMMKLLN